MSGRTTPGRDHHWEAAGSLLLVLDGAERLWLEADGDADHVCVVGEGMLFASAIYGGSPSDPLDIPRWDTLVERYDANKDAMLGVTEMPREEGIHLRREVAKDAPGNFLSWPRAMAMTDGNKDGLVTKGEWDAILAFLRSNEDNVLAIRPGGTGDSSNSHVAWKASRGISEMPSPLFYRGRLYFVRNGGMVTSTPHLEGVLDRSAGHTGLKSPSVAPTAASKPPAENGTIVVSSGRTLEVLRATISVRLTATPDIADHKLYSELQITMGSRILGDARPPRRQCRPPTRR